VRPELRHAYAVLGLKPPASAGEVKRQYHKLARVWHPDRFVSDPSGEKEANIRMKEINEAFAIVFRSFAPFAGPAAAKPTHTPPGARLSREEIESLIQSINRTNGSAWWPLRLNWGALRSGSLFSTLAGIGPFRLRR
jgi:hypothetical protein